MEQLAIIGSGTMGHSIAVNALWAGLNVTLYGTDARDIHKGLEGLQHKLGTLSDHDLVRAGDISDIYSRLKTTDSLDEAILGATFIIECIPEELHLKQSLFLELDRKCSPAVVLASNTSGLSLTGISRGMSHPQRAILTHFWNPAHLIPLVEVLRGASTSDEVFDRTMALLSFMRKKPVVVRKEVPGLIGNRLQFALFREAQYLLDEGIADKEDIDAAVQYSFGRRLPATGPLLSADMGGLDVFASISDYLFKDLSNEGSSSATLRKLVSENKLGTKTGGGYYRWTEDFSNRVNEERERELIRFLKQDRSID